MMKMQPMTREQIIEMVADQIIDGKMTEGVPEDEILARVMGTGPEMPVLFMVAEPVSRGRILLVLPREDSEGFARGATELVNSFPEVISDLIGQANYFAERMN